MKNAVFVERARVGRAEGITGLGILNGGINMFKNHNVQGLCLTLVLCMAGLPGTQAAIVIDDFEEGGIAKQPKKEGGRSTS